MNDSNRERPIILASSSPRRKELLAALKLPFTVDPSDADETIPPGMAPAQAVEMLALRKARSVASRYDAGLVIGSDTVVVVDGDILGKPRDAADACRMLARLQGRAHEVYTGLALVDAAGESASASAHTVSRVTFGPMGEDEIRAYAATGEPMDKAGAYGVQGMGAVFIARLEGDFYSVMGLPLHLLYRMLRRFDVDPFYAI